MSHDNDCRLLQLLSVLGVLTIKWDTFLIFWVNMKMGHFYQVLNKKMGYFSQFLGYYQENGTLLSVHEVLTRTWDDTLFFTSPRELKSCNSVKAVTLSKLNYTLEPTESSSDLPDCHDASSQKHSEAGSMLVLVLQS